MSVRVQCPHCHGVCQVNDTNLGAPVQCGRCSRPFTVRVPTAQAAPASLSRPGVSAPVASVAHPGAAGGHFWGELRGLFGAPGSTPAASAPRPAPSANDDDVSLDWDAPGAAARMADPNNSASHSTPVVAAATPAFASVRLEIGSATSSGRVRPHNEDSFLVQQLAWSNLDQRRDLALVVVADGVGGYQAGDQASGLVIRLVGNTVAPLLANVLTGQVKDVPLQQLLQTLDGALRGANRTVHQRAQTSAACKGMASTVAAVLIWDGKVAIGHVGDCRVYHQRGQQLTQVTHDQTLVERMLQLGQLTPREAERHPSRNEVAQAVGRHPDITPAAYQLQLAAGDWLIVACDGLHAHVDARALDNAIRQASSAPALARHLVDLANQGGGSDNCTVVAVRCS